jgi:hypothetical protein
MSEEMLEEKYLPYFEILEVEGDATLADVKNAYERLKKLYSFHSIALEPIDDEFEEDDKMEILREIDEAYQALLRYIVERDRVEKEQDKSGEEARKEMEDTASEAIGEDKREEDKKEEKEPEPEPLPFEDTGPDLPPPPREPPEELEVSVDEDPFSTMVAPPEEKESPLLADSAEALDTKEFGQTVERIVPPLLEDTIPEERIGEPEQPEPPEPPEELEEPEVIEPPEAGPAEAGISLQGVPIKGRTLRKVREKLGLGIHDLALSTGISYRILVNLEKERFEKLPAGGMLRWNVTTYAKALKLDPHMVAEEYMKRYRQWQREH